MLTTDDNKIFTLSVSKNRQGLLSVICHLEYEDITISIMTDGNKVLDSFVNEYSSLVWTLNLIKKENANTLIMTNGNRVLVALVKGNPIFLASQLSCLEPDDLNRMLTDASNGVVASLVKVGSKDLAKEVLVKLHPEDLKAVLRTEINSKTIRKRIKNVLKDILNDFYLDTKGYPKKCLLQIP
jgi:hypothetical protein